MISCYFFQQLSFFRVLLLFPSVDPTADNNTPLRLAATNGHLQVVELLLTYPDVDITAHDNDAFIGAAANGHINIVCHLSFLSFGFPTTRFTTLSADREFLSKTPRGGPFFSKADVFL